MEKRLRLRVVFCFFDVRSIENQMASLSFSLSRLLLTLCAAALAFSGSTGAPGMARGRPCMISTDFSFRLQIENSERRKNKE